MIFGTNGINATITLLAINHTSTYPADQFCPNKQLTHTYSTAYYDHIKTLLFNEIAEELLDPPQVGHQKRNIKRRMR